MAVDTLITGVCGMIGSHLAQYLAGRGQRVTGTFYRPATDLAQIDRRVELLEMDLRYAAHVAQVIGRFKPAAIYHLGAQSYPTVSWERPQETLDTNATGTANVFEAIKAARAIDASYSPAVVVACSSAEYGSSLLLSDGPVSEDAALLPLHPYGVSKVATDLLAYQYFKSNGIRSFRARIFNTSGPRKSGDVISDFARRIAAMPAGGGQLRVGNLATRRAFLHVNDTLAALVGLGERGEAGQVYNVSGREAHSSADLLPLFEAVSGKKIVPKLDTALLRPMDEPVIWGDISRISRDIGWEPALGVAAIVRDVYEYEAARSGGLA